VAAPTRPSERVLDLFAVPDDVRPLPGGQGASVVAGDLVLSPGRDAATASWLCPPVARLAVALDLRPRRSLRLAMPVPARDGEWVVDGWAASRYEPDTTACTDLDVLVATGRLLHAELAVAFPTRPAGLDQRTDHWAEAERIAFATPDEIRSATKPDDPRGNLLAVAADVVEGAGDVPLGTDQLVHGDLAGNVLLDASGTPVVIDLAPYWRPPMWAEAVCVLDAVLWLGADARTLADWSHGIPALALARAVTFRLLSDGPLADVDRYAAALAHAWPSP
jgi:hypothetical protein